jgi:hypothetical protein
MRDDAVFVAVPNAVSGFEILKYSSVALDMTHC